MFMTKEKFEKLVISTVTQKDLNILDSIKYVCENLEIDFEDVNRFMTDNLKDILEREAKMTNLIKEN